jgi:hypothetical protein
MLLLQRDVSTEGLLCAEISFQWNAPAANSDIQLARSSYAPRPSIV